MVESKKISSWTTLADGSIVSNNSPPSFQTNDRCLTEDGTIIYRNNDSLSEFDTDFGTYEIEYLNDRNPSRLFRLGTVLEETQQETSPTRRFFQKKNKTSGNSVYICVNDTTTEKNRFGIALTMIINIADDPRLQLFKNDICTGDILISINGLDVLGMPFKEILDIINSMKSNGKDRVFKFLNIRKQPITKYLRNRDWNDSLQRDMLGFHCTFEYMLNEKQNRDAASNVINQRDMAWVLYLKSIGGPENLKPAGIFKPSKDLKSLVRRGIPVAYRSLVWQKISLSSIHRLSFPKDYYNSLLERVANGELDHRVQEDIEKDVDRTFPEHIYFESSGNGETGLRRVLRAFALHNPDVGYCQSLNFVAGLMLIFMEEEDAFWLLLTVVERLLPSDYYTKSMVGTYVDQYVLAHIIKKHLPKIHTTLEKNQLQLPLITVQWFMCLFINTLPPETTLRVWDLFLNEGSKVLFRVACALFKMNEKQLLAVKDAADLFSIIRNIGKEAVDPDKLISLAYSSYAIENKHLNNSNNNNSNLVVSPRLLIHKKEKGIVPDNLIGIGLAHEGPISKDQLIRNTSNTEIVDVSLENKKSDKYNNDEENENSLKYLGFSDSNKTKAIASLLNNNNRMSNEFLSADKFERRKKKKIVYKNGVFNFYRTDIALWRHSFRPSLEDRFISMEAIRDTWRKNNDIIVQPNEDNIQIDNDDDNDINILEYVENEKLLINTTVTTTVNNNLDISRSVDSYSPSSMMWRSSLVIDRSVLLDTVDEEEILSNTYNVDHSYEKEK